MIMIPEIDKGQLGDRLKKLLKTKNISAREVQEYLSLSCVQTVYRWMEGINIPCIDHLYALSVLTGFSMDYLVSGNEQAVSGTEERKNRCRDQFLLLWQNGGSESEESGAGCCTVFGNKKSSERRNQVYLQQFITMFYACPG